MEQVFWMARIFKIKMSKCIQIRLSSLICNWLKIGKTSFQLPDADKSFWDDFRNAVMQQKLKEKQKCYDERQRQNVAQNNLMLFGSVEMHLFSLSFTRSHTHWRTHTHTHLLPLGVNCIGVSSTRCQKVGARMKSEQQRFKIFTNFYFCPASLSLFHALSHSRSHSFSLSHSLSLFHALSLILSSTASLSLTLFLSRRNCS